MSNPSILAILKDLESSSSRLKKEAILAANKDNELLQRVFKMALDPYINYWIKAVPIDDGIPRHSMSLIKALDGLEDLINRKYTGNSAIVHLTNLLYSVDRDDCAVLSRIVHRDLRCGVSTKTVNKIWKGLIPEFPIMKCAKNDAKTLAKIPFPAIVQKKEDGGRLVAIVREGAVSFHSSSGKELDLLDAPFIDYLYEMRKHSEDDFVIDGELLYFNDALSTSSNRQTGNGIMTKAIRGTMTEEESTRLLYVMWDYIPLDDYQNGHSKIKMIDRFNILNSLYLCARCDETQHMVIVDSLEVKTLDDAVEVFNHMLAKGFEGIILKDKNGPFENKRVKHQVKFKDENSADLRIRRVVIGTGKNKDRMGALEVYSDDGKIEVGVGTGFSDKDRDWFWEHRDEVVDMVVEVAYNAIIEDKHRPGISSLFLPVYKRPRTDKTSTNTLEEL